MKHLIRPESPQDIAGIDALTRAAFLDAPHTDHTEHFIVEALRQAGALDISLLAEEAGTLLGHIAVSPVSVSDGAPGWYGIGPLSVSPAWQRQGIGSSLVRAALLALRQRGAAGCVVLGDPAFYGRFGFRPKAELVLADVPPEYFMALTLDDTAPPRGQVCYHEAFNTRGPLGH